MALIAQNIYCLDLYREYLWEPDTEEQWDLKVKFSAIYVETDLGK